MNEISKRKVGITLPRLLLMIILLTGRLLSISAYNQIYNLNVGDQFTVYAAYHYKTTAVLWSFDHTVVEPVGYVGPSARSVTFRCIAASPRAGSVIQAVTYYYDSSTSYVLKDVDDWLLYVKDNSTVSLSSDYEDLAPGDRLSLTATPSNSSYSGKYTWSSSNSTIASVSSSSSSSVTVQAKSTGSATITVKLDNGNSAKCEVTVRPVNVTSATVTPSYKDVYIDKTETLSLSVYPSNAIVTSKSWKSRNTSIATVNSSGVVTGVSAGKTEIYCIVNGNVTSSSCDVTVLKPSFTLSSTTPSDGATGQSVHIKPSMTFCRQIYQGSSFSGITLKDGGGKAVSGTASMSGSTLTFAPSEPLEPNTSYTFNVPSQAVKDKYGSTNSTVTRSFTTGNLEKLTLTPSTTDRFIAKGAKVSLTCNKTGISIYYTLDGSKPTSASQRYDSGIIIDRDIQLRAIAMGPGYVNSDILAVDYLISNVGITARFPIDEEPLYHYKDMMPYVAFGNRMVAGDHIKKVVLKKNGTAIEMETIINDNTLFLVPQEPLELGCSYTVDIPAGAVKSWQGEDCKGTTWSFTTGEFATGISAGPELMTAIKTDGSLWTWGEQLTKANAEDGSYSYTYQEEPASLVSNDVVAVSAGYMHNALLKRDGSLWMWGRQLCGEFGNGSTTASVQPVKVMDGVKSVSCGLQTTAVVKQDGTLWMCGRNDMGQIDESRMVKNQFVKVGEKIREVVLNWGSLSVIKSDGTKETRTWDENADSKRKPLEPQNVTTEFSEVKYGWKNAVALGKDGSVWTWNDSSSKVTPQKVVEGRKSSKLTGLTVVNPTVSVGVGSKTVLVAKPFPLIADYTTLTWKSSNSKIAKVSSRGIVTCVASGSATITAKITSANGQSFSKTFNVMNNGQVKLSKTKATMEKGKSGTLKATVYPETLTDKSVTWKRSNKKVATVSSAGKVKAVGVGTATITCTSVATGAKATCKVTVGQVVLSKSEAIVAVGKTGTLKATVYPETLADKSVTWTTSDKKVATVTSAGKVKAVGVGTAVITCTSVATGLKATCTLTVGQVVLSKTEATVAVGKTGTLKATVYPETLEDKSVTWRSSDTKVATVTSAGKVKAVGVGTAIITCTSNATGLSATCTLTVGKVVLSKSKATVAVGKAGTLKATVYPETLADKSVTWKSSDTEVATVTSAGKVKAVGVGTAIITCTSNATGLSATCTLTVTASASTRSLDGDDDEVTGFEDMGPAVTEPYDVYDLSGRMVRHQVTSLDGLPNGIYIVKGRKVLKKD